MVISLKTEFNNIIPNELKSILQSIAMVSDETQINIYLIGGVVRDLILNRHIKDIDIAVEGNAVEFCKILEAKLNCTLISTQDNLKTSRVKFSNDIEIDFASTREEKYLKPGALPSAFNFGCKLEDDIKRRDFTINTLALKLCRNNKYNIIDYFNGYEDIKNKKIRLLHEKSFLDDPSRIIRALKFKQRLNFDFDDKTYSIMQNYLSTVDYTIPFERIKGELRQYFSISKDGLYKEIIDSNAYKLISNNPFLNFNEKLLHKLSNYQLFDDNDKWLIYIILLIVNSDFIVDKLNLTSYEKKIIKEIKELLNHFPVNIEDKKEIYNAFIEKTDLSIAVYYIMTQDKSVEKFLEVLKQIQILITGKDLIELGFIPSAYFSELFEKILIEKLDGKLQTKQQEIEFVKQFLNKSAS